jgi:undecaprenyl diphosphate synthase
MDRNGEWARKRSLSRINGHREGVKAVQRIVESAARMNIEVLSLFAFSTENWLRPEDEVSFLMGLLEEYIKKEARRLIKNNIKLVTSGRLDRIPSGVAAAVRDVVAESAANTGMVLNVALDYGGQDELVNAAKEIAIKVATGEISPDAVDKDLFRQHFYHPELPDVDLLIRTGGVERISNFMLWQLAYAELYFPPVFWPDYSEDDLKEAIEAFGKRERRFGMTGEQVRKA